MVSFCRLSRFAEEASEDFNLHAGEVWGLSARHSALPCRRHAPAPTPAPPAFPPICGTGAIRSGEDTANQISAMLSAKRG